MALYLLYLVCNEVSYANTSPIRILLPALYRGTLT